MNSINLTPFDRIGPVITSTCKAQAFAPGSPAYNIEALSDNEYIITLAVAGFSINNINVSAESGVLTVSGEPSHQKNNRYLYQGIANTRFERRFDLTDFVEITRADLHDGLLSISLVRDIPETLGPKSICINKGRVIAGDTKSYRPEDAAVEAA